MRIKFIPAAIALLAGAVTGIFNLVNRIELVAGLKRLLLVLILFYIIGWIVKYFVTKAVDMSSKKKVAEEEQDTTSNGTDTTQNL